MNRDFGVNNFNGKAWKIPHLGKWRYFGARDGTAGRVFMMLAVSPNVCTVMERPDARLLA
jgi:hypothetical protein